MVKKLLELFIKSCKRQINQLRIKSEELKREKVKKKEKLYAK